jgi:hypothetical protein
MKNFYLTLIACLSLISFAARAQTSDAAADAALPGFELTDAAHGFKIIMPNGLWNITATKYAISITHNTLFDVFITLKKGWYAVATAQDAYKQRRESLKTYLPGAVFVKENEEITIGNAPAVSMTYTNPGDKKVVREIMFMQHGVSYELSFTVNQENFEAVKQDFGLILQKLQLL